MAIGGPGRSACNPARTVSRALTSDYAGGRVWDGTRWFDAPDLARRTRRGIALAWTALLPLTLLWSIPEAGAVHWCLFGLIAAVHASGTAVAWRGLDRPLPADSSFPPGRVPARRAAAGWLSDPTERAASRYWNGRRWTEHVSSLPPASAGFDT